MQTLTRIAENLIEFINDVAVPLVFALAFILFLWGIFRYFLLKSQGKLDDALKEGRKFAIWGIVALAVMISVWGLVRILIGTFGLGGESRPCLPTFRGSSDCSGAANVNRSRGGSDERALEPNPYDIQTPGGDGIY